MSSNKDSDYAYDDLVGLVWDAKVHGNRVWGFTVGWLSRPSKVGTFMD
jgi:hypothetical protein